MKMNLKFSLGDFLKWFLVFALVIFLVFIFSAKNANKFSFKPDYGIQANTQSKSVKYVKIAGKILEVELALTPQAQARGLSGRSELKEDEGMLFVFNDNAKHSFWMKDMNFPIDIIWIGEDMKIVFIKKNALPESYPKTFVPDQNAKYVLEVVSGFSERNGLKEGDEVEFLS